MKSRENFIPQESLRSLSTEGLAVLGADKLAYIRFHKIKEQAVYVVHGANGAELAGFDNYTAAITACFENELEMVALH